MKEKNNKITGICFLAASICYFICAIIGFFSENSNGLAVPHLGLGACFFCLSFSYFMKDKKK